MSESTFCLKIESWPQQPVTAIHDQRVALMTESSPCVWLFVLGFLEVRCQSVWSVIALAFIACHIITAAAIKICQ